MAAIVWAVGAGLWPYVLLAAVLVVAAVLDARTAKIPNWVTYPAVGIGLVGHTVVGGVMGEAGQMGLAQSAVGLAVGFVPMLLAWRAGGIGGGDAKLMGGVGALAGWRFALSSMFYGLVVAALMAVFVMIRRRITKRTLGRIWRFVYLVFAQGKPASPAEADSPKIPFGLALCIGAAVELADFCLGGPVSRSLFGA